MHVYIKGDDEEIRTNIMILIPGRQVSVGISLPQSKVGLFLGSS